MARISIKKILTESKFEYGALLDPKKFDPINPEIQIKGFGSMDRGTLRKGIAKRLENLARTAKEAATGGPNAFNQLKTIEDAISPGGVVYQMIKADIEVAEQLETMRRKGGRRDIPIPKQF